MEHQMIVRCALAAAASGLGYVLYRHRQNVLDSPEIDENNTQELVEHTETPPCPSGGQSSNDNHTSVLPEQQQVEELNNIVIAAATVKKLVVEAMMVPFVGALMGAAVGETVGLETVGAVLGVVLGEAAVRGDDT
jgi:acetyl-CoA carboxylase beta subunit